MKDFFVSLADLKIGISVLNGRTANWFSKYMISTDRKPDFCIAVNQELIEKEKKLYAGEMQLCDLQYPEPEEEQYELIALLRRLAIKMPAYDGFVFHGSVLSVDNCGYVFTAKSGGGKSTHASLWKKLLGEKAIMVNDDKPIIRLIDNEIFAYGSPWSGKDNLDTNCRVPLKAICIVEKAAENSIKEIDIDEASGILMQQVYRPENSADLLHTMKLIAGFEGKVRFYRMKCNMDISAAKMSYEFMSGHKITGAL